MHAEEGHRVSSSTPDTYQKDFSYDDLIVRVSSDDPSALSWLEEFLSPQFEVGERGAYDCRVRLIADTKRYEATLHGRAWNDGQLEECFALDSGPVRLPLWDAPSTDRIIFDQAHTTFYVMDPRNASVDVLTPVGNLAARLSLMRVIREFAMNDAIGRGRLILHASGLVVGGKGIMMAGPKGAGKTTLMIHLLRHPGAEYVSNDRIVITYDDRGLRFRGMPTIVTIRFPTLEMFPVVRDRLLSSPYRDRLTLGEAKTARKPFRAMADPQVSLSPAQLCDLLRVRSAGHGGVEALVFPQVTGRSGGIELEQLSTQAAAARLADSVFSVRSPNRASRVFVLSANSPGPDQGWLESLCRRLVSQVRCYDCRLGSEAYESERTAATFLQHVLQ